MHEEFINEPCPFLPAVDRIWKSADISVLGEERGAAFYDASLQYAQSQWRCGFPGQALLQINRSFVCVLPVESMKWPLAYQAVAWLLAQRREGQFIGNPRRHFQHLATRMVEPNKELRTWRAWACWDIARSMLSEVEFPGDLKQIRDEGVVEPTRERIQAQLGRLSPADDIHRWLHALEWAEGKGLVRGRKTSNINADFRLIDEDEVGIVSDLAHRIWPQVYPSIISEEQIRYMLEWMYSPEALRRDIRDKRVTYALIRLGGEVAGYIGCGPEEDALFLHKLYLLPEHAGRGLGAAALDWVFRRAGEMGLPLVKLRVNKSNTGAVRAYLRAGFVFEQDIIADIGGGFVMDDHVMVRHLNP